MMVTSSQVTHTRRTWGCGTPPCLHTPEQQITMIHATKSCRDLQMDSWCSWLSCELDTLKVAGPNLAEVSLGELTELLLAHPICRLLTKRSCTLLESVSMLLQLDTAVFRGPPFCWLKGIALENVSTPSIWHSSGSVVAGALMLTCWQVTHPVLMRDFGTPSCLHTREQLIT